MLTGNFSDRTLSLSHIYSSRTKLIQYRVLSLRGNISCFGVLCQVSGTSWVKEELTPKGVVSARSKTVRIACLKKTGSFGQLKIYLVNSLIQIAQGLY